MEYEIKIEAILEEELYTNPSLIPVLVADLVGTRRDIGKVFELTKNLTPIEELKHLRRIRETDGAKIECIVCKLDPAKVGRCSGDDAQFINEIVDTLKLGGLLQNYRIINVPSKAAKTDQQLEACLKIWPTKFSKCNNLIKCIDGSIVSKTERIVVKMLVNHLIEYARAENQGFTSCAVIFRYAKIYGLGLSCCEILSSNPTKHAPMVAIDSVANEAGAGHWLHKSCQNSAKLMSTMQQQLDDRSELLDHKIDANFLPYICTNYDVLVTEEPCIMCTMGLIQSRIRRLFYLDRKQLDLEHFKIFSPVCYLDQAIEKFFIHRDSRINHKFEAWKIKLFKNDC